MAVAVPIHGRVLAELRLVRLLTQAQLARRCQDHDRHCGLTARRIGEYERGELSPSIANLRVIAEVLELDPAEVRALVVTPGLDAFASVSSNVPGWGSVTAARAHGPTSCAW